jgi:hypothetical protein
MMGKRKNLISLLLFTVDFHVFSSSNLLLGVISTKMSLSWYYDSIVPPKRYGSKVPNSLIPIIYYGGEKDFFFFFGV